MSSTDPPSGDPALDLFLTRFLRDLRDGDADSLAEYVARFPRAAEEIERLEDETHPTEAGAGEGGARVLTALAAGELREVGPYRLIRPLGQGGQGSVWLAEDSRLGRRVALKFLTGLGLLSPDALARFRREAEVASRLDHPGICTVYAIDREQGIPYIAMRWVDGPSLDRVLEIARLGTAPEPNAPDASPLGATTPDTRREIDAVLALCESLARTVHAAHEAGVVHRDLKPANVMVPADGPPVVLDFGLARPLHEEGTALTRSGQVFGTPAYMAPEQVDPSRGPVDVRTDVHALGAILYECLTLQRPFSAPTIDALYREILERPAPDPRRANPAVPKDVAVVVTTALEKDPDHRYVGAEALAEDLRRVREHLPIAARPAGPVLRLRRWARRNPAIAASLAALFLVLSGALALSLSLLDDARRSEDLAKAESQRARAEEAEALRQQALALEESARARHNLGLAREAVDRFLTRVGERSLRHVPHMGSLRRELLQDAREFYRALVERSPTDDDLRREAALTRVRLATIDEWLGELAAAEAAARSGCDLLETLRGEAAPARLARDRGEARAVLGLVLGRQGRLEEALDALAAARTDLHAALEADPGDHEARRRLAAVLDNRAHCHLLTGALDAQDRCREEAVALREELARAHPEDPRIQAGVVAALAASASAFTNTGRPERARPLRERALERCERLLAKHPEVVELREQHAALLHDLAIHDADTDPAAAVRRIRGAIAIYDALRRDYPASTEYRRLASDAWAALGVYAAQAGLEEDAEAAFDRALREREALAREHPEDPEHTYGLAVHHLNDALRAVRAAAPERADAAYRRGIDLLRGLVAAHPRHANYRARLARALHDRAWMLRDRRASAEARRGWREALAVQRALPAGDARDEGLHLYWWNLLYTIAGAGDGDAVLEGIAEMRREFAGSDHWRHPLLGARMAAMAAASEEDPERGRRLVRRALAELAEAAERGFAERGLLGADGPFTGLVEAPEWAALVARIEANAAAARD